MTKDIKDEREFIIDAVTQAKIPTVHPDAANTIDIGRAVLAAYRNATTTNPTAAQPLDLNRYDIDCDGLSLKHKNGVWVAYEDVAALIAPASQPVAPSSEHKWHAPGMGEVHYHDHSLMIECVREIDDPDQDYMADDELAKQVCDALNNAAVAPSDAKGKADAANAGELLAALRDFVDNSQEHDVGGGDVVIATCESRERAAALLEKYRDKSLGVCGIKPSECPDSNRCGCEGCGADTGRRSVQRSK